MIDHVSIGVRDIARTKRFYDAALKPLGYKCLTEGEGSLGYGKDAVTLWMSSTDRPVPADLKSGLHFCFVAPTPRSVEAFHAAALSNGGRDNGRLACARITVPITMRPLSSIPTAIGSRRIAAVPQHDPRNLRSRFKIRRAGLRRPFHVDAS
jgi:catechol 2,3-dioxygenase-like lactoylglutathione lyase family enzyme